MISVLGLIATASVVGLSLGLLGGGGSTITVPMLIYAMGMDEKTAIATSLFVVCLTALSGAVVHARQGNVVWRTAAIFGSTAMVGAYLGGRIAHFVPGSVLMTLFAVLMFVTALGMWRGRRTQPSTRTGAGAGTNAGNALRLPRLSGTQRLALRGLLVGGMTGLIGAGGGFLIVPALVLLGGLSMKAAVGTSLAIIAMNSAAGFAGYAAHVAVDFRVAATLAAVAAVATSIGALWAQRLPQQALRRAFSILVGVMGVLILAKQLPMEFILSSLTAVPMPAVVGGVLIGVAAAGMMLLNGRVMGVSGILAGTTAQNGKERAWRLLFLLGMAFGAALVALLWPDKVPTHFSSTPATLAIAGVLVGFGTRLGSGCTSGHGICGLPRGSPRSIVATILFTLVAAGTVFLTRHVS